MSPTEQEPDLPAAPLSGATSGSSASASSDASSGAPPGTPRFAREFPRDAALDGLVAAFVAGNYARVRDEGAKLAASSDDLAVSRAARELMARTDPDPLARILLAITGVLLVFLTGWWLVHDHPAGPPASSPPATKSPAVEHVD